VPVLVQRELKRSIIEIFNKDEFFTLNIQTLKYWQKIVNITLENTSDLLMLYVEKLSLAQSLFSSEGKEHKARIKIFKRICFLIFSGQRDRYLNCLDLLLDKMCNVIRHKKNQSPNLLILIFFCLRILILRFSSSNLNQLFKNIWPILLSLLIEIFS